MGSWILRGFPCQSMTICSGPRLDPEPMGSRITIVPITEPRMEQLMWGARVGSPWDSSGKQSR